MAASAVRLQPSSKRTLEVIVVGSGFGGIAVRAADPIRGRA
jgi:hypothetical protein